MSPRKRTKEEGSANVAEDVSTESRHAESGENTEEYPKFQPSLYRRPRRSDGVKWFPVVKRLFYFSLLFLVPMILNYAALHHEMRVLPPKSAVVYDIGWGQKLLLHCTGSGLPTVILEAPIGQASYVWSSVQPIVAKHTRVCSYDRAGLGFSDRAYKNTSRYTEDYGDATKERDKTLPSTVERMVEDLHKLLTVSSNQPKPFVMVSSDFTTMVSRFYAQLYEYEIAGLVLIDPAPETTFDPSTPSPPSPPDTHDQYSGTQAEGPMDNDNSPWTTHWYRDMVPRLQGLHMSGSLGFNRLELMVGLMSPLEIPELSNLLTDDIIAIKKHLLCQPKHLSSAFDEYYFMNESISQLKTVFQLKPFPDIPTNIATFEKTSDALPTELTKIWKREQKKMIRRFHQQSHRTTLPGSDYVSLYTHPETVAQAILDMVKDWRQDSRAAQ